MLGFLTIGKRFNRLTLSNAHFYLQCFIVSIHCRCTVPTWQWRYFTLQQFASCNNQDLPPLYERRRIPPPTGISLIKSLALPFPTFFENFAPNLPLSAFSVSFSVRILLFSCLCVLDMIRISGSGFFPRTGFL